MLSIFLNSILAEQLIQARYSLILVISTLIFATRTWMNWIIGIRLLSFLILESTILKMHGYVK